MWKKETPLYDKLVGYRYNDMRYNDFKTTALKM